MSILDEQKDIIIVPLRGKAIIIFSVVIATTLLAAIATSVVLRLNPNAHANSCVNRITTVLVLHLRRQRHYRSESASVAVELRPTSGPTPRENNAHYSDG